MIKTYIWDADARCARDGVVNVSQNWPDGLVLQKNWQVYEELQRHKRAIEWLFDRLPPAYMDEGPPSDIADLIKGQS